MDSPPALPPLRPDLLLQPGVAAPGGVLPWLLHDPTRNRFFEIGPRERLLLKYWSAGNREGVRQRLEEEEGVRVEPSGIDAFAAFLDRNQLTLVPWPRQQERRARFRGRRRLQLSPRRLFSFRFPFPDPGRLLARLDPWAEPFFHPVVLWLFALLGMVALFLVSRRWDEFLHTFSYFGNTASILPLAITLAVTKVVHELGHALAAARRHVPIRGMGVSVIFFLPLLYTDTTEAWRLPDRRGRMIISLAGVAAETLLAILALLLWSFAPEGAVKSAAFFLATVSLVSSLAVNLNPLMRFDGYFLLADAVGLSNLQHRAFAMGRWRLREFFLGLDLPSPEPDLPPASRRFLARYALAVWCYRLLIFLGLALFAYHFFFKLAGVIILVLEFGVLVAGPLLAEGKVWWRMRTSFTWNRATIRGALLLTTLSLFLLLPWHSRISLPAVEMAGVRMELFAPVAARVQEVRVARGERVSRGSPLVLLESPDLAFQAGQVQRKIQALRLKLDGTVSREAVSGNRSVLEREYALAIAEEEAVAAKSRLLTLTAPMSGRVMELDPALRSNRWVTTELPLLLLAEEKHPILEAFVREEEMPRLRGAVEGRFYPENPDREPFSVRILRIEEQNTPRLESPYLASIHGGPLPVTRQKSGELIQHETVYRLLLFPFPAHPLPMQVERGTVQIQGEAESLAGRFLRRMLAVLVRESGF